MLWIVTDNASNVAKAMKILQVKQVEKEKGEALRQNETKQLKEDKQVALMKERRLTLKYRSWERIW
jgi:hypothetical protein